jgi:hypothetical protein
MYDQFEINSAIKIIAKLFGIAEWDGKLVKSRWGFFHPRKTFPIDIR